MNTKTFLKIFTLVMCLATTSCGNNGSNTAVLIDYTKPFEKWETNEFFGVDLNQEGQVEMFHRLLESGVLYWNKTNLREWTDDIMSDYEMSDGNVSTTCLFEGNGKESMSTFEYVDAVLQKRYQNRSPFKQGDWKPLSGDLFRMVYTLSLSMEITKLPLL